MINLGHVYRFQNEYHKAAKYFNQYILKHPEIAKPYFYIGLTYFDQKQIIQSRKYFQKAINRDPDLVIALDFLAQTYSSIKDYKTAEKHYRHIVNLHPDYKEAKYHLGTLVQAQGNINEAIELFEDTIKIDSSFSQAHYAFSLLHDYQNTNDPQLIQMEQEYKRSTTNDSKIYLSFALAKAYEDIKSYKKAFEYLHEGNRLRNLEYNYSIQSDTDLIDQVISIFNKDTLNQTINNSISHRKFIFIVGLPRSGSSLVDKIISSHSEVISGGELTFIDELAEQYIMQGSRLKALDYANVKLINKMSKIYTDNIKNIDSGQQVVTDKGLRNTLWLGLIKILFPNSKIIYCNRNSEDNCLSIYKNNFTGNGFTYAYDLKSLGEYYMLHKQLMAHWKRVMPESIYEIKYENLTVNPTEEIKQLISFCDMDWQESCLDFHKTKGRVETASLYQVRQPIYTKSVDSWKNYHEFLTPLLDIIQEPSNLKK